ncbi:MAG: hypothetical protein KAU21_01400 [Gammaproteobacteria bacterium]|nr:hypothetical protein [Gammaproteobacteria bacterium]
MSSFIYFIVIFFTLSLLTVSISFAWDYSQHVKYNYSNIEYPDNSLFVLNGGITQAFNSVNYRLNVAEKFNSLSFETNYEFISLHSDSSNLSFINPDDNRLFNLTSTLNDNPDQLTYHRLDRLYITYRNDHLITRFGRQAVTWGNGFVYNVMDIFNPFSPVAIDTEYKSGDDMLYVQTLIESGDDWQFIALPRRDIAGDIDNSESSLAIKFHTNKASTDIDVLLAQHYDSDVIGIGLSHAIAESMWRFDITHTSTPDNKNFTSLSTNVDYSWTGFGKNMYGFIEYYYNGFGMDNNSATASTALLSRLQRGELFAYYRDYLALGIRTELHPLVNLSTTVIHNISINKSLLNLLLSYDVKQNLTFNTQLSISDHDNQNQSNQYDNPNNTFSLLLSYYF